MGSTTTAPVYGQRLLLTLLDDLARDRPDDLYSRAPKTKNITDGFHEVTFRDFARSVNKVAFWLERTIGRSTTFETVAYIGAADLRYYVAAFAATKLGFKTLFPSTRNTIEGTRSLMAQMQCRTLITSEEIQVVDLLENGARHLIIESLADMLSKGSDIEHYPYDKTFDVAKDDPFIVIHTSGSTGLPKPITMYQGGLATADAHHNLQAHNGQSPKVQQLLTASPSLHTLPPFHMGGIMLSLLIALYYRQVIIWLPAGRPVSVDLIEDILDNVKVGSCFLSPSILEEMSQSQDSLDRLRRLETVGFGGGPLAKAAGDKISQYTKIQNMMGSSECTFMPTHASAPEDWQSFTYSPELHGFRFEQVDEKLYEQVIVRDPSTDPYHSTWYTFPNQNRYATHDLYSKHPGKENMWLYAGRSDDVLVLSNGEKLDPNAMQSVLLDHPDVKGALVFGQARFEPGALIELRRKNPQPSEGQEIFNKSFQPYIDKANESAPAYGKLGYDHIIFAQPDKPMLRADKGTIKRSATLKSYAQEIDDFYERIKISDASTAVELNIKDRSSLVASLTPVVRRICHLKHIHFADDFFSMGIDSLQVMTMTRQIKSSISLQNKAAAEGVSTKLIYSNPSIAKLAAAIFGLLHPEMDSGEDPENVRITAMKQTVEDFSAKLPTSNVSKSHPGNKGLTLVLTGSTGSLGSYMLDDALSRSEITKIICLNRSTNCEARQRSSHASKGLTQDWQGKVQFLQADLSKPHLGLDEDQYRTILNEANLIIHNQWQVDFNLSLTSFTPHLAGVLNLIHLSATSPLRPPLIFTSSISTLGNWLLIHPGQKVPETPQHDYRIPAATGYGESKFIAERILENAAQTSGVASAVIRVGQLAGPVEKRKGVWNRKEWLPSLVASSAHLGILPTRIPGLNDVAWIPVDLAARAILDLAASSAQLLPGPNGTMMNHHQNPQHAVYNLTNPHPSSWSRLLPTITAHLLAHDRPVRITDYGTWLAALRESSTAEEEEEKQGIESGSNPAVKLLGFFEALVGGEEAVMATAETVGRSAVMKGLEGVGEEWMGLWMEQWGW
ncbi:MAG: hypothetical protein Q9182_004762 [Xanthomendoza sp. 2 TL-2023]